MSKEIVLNKNQMAFYIYNLFGHDIAHDGHPAGLGEGRFAKAIKRSSEGPRNFMSSSNKGGGPFMSKARDPDEMLHHDDRPDDDDDDGDDIDHGEMRIDKNEEQLYFESIGEMTSRNTLITSIGEVLIPAGKLYSANIPRDSATDSKQWQDINLIIINVPGIIANFSNNNNNKELYPGFIYFNGEIFNPYDAVLYSQPSPDGLNSIQIMVSLENFVITIPNSDFIYIQEKNSPTYITYHQVNNNNFQLMIDHLGVEFFYSSFNNYMKTTTFLKLQTAPDVYFVYYVLKKTGPNKVSQNFYNILFQLYNDILIFKNKSSLVSVYNLSISFLELLHTFTLFRYTYNEMYITYCKYNFNIAEPNNISLDTLVQVFVGQISQQGYRIKNKISIYTILDLFGGDDNLIDEKTIELIIKNKTKIIQNLRRKTNKKYEEIVIKQFIKNINNFTISEKLDNEILMIKDFFIISKISKAYLTKYSENDNYLMDDENDNILIDENMQGGASQKLDYEAYVVPYKFINVVIEGVPSDVKSDLINNLDDTSKTPILLDPTTIGIINTYLHNKIQLNDIGIKDILPRNSLPEAYAQSLYGPISSPYQVIKDNELLTFFIKNFPSTSDIESLSSLDQYKSKLFNDPTINKTFVFLQDLNNLFKNTDDRTNNMNSKILSLLILHTQDENELLSLFKYNASGVVPKEYSKKIGILAAFEQSMIRQIRIVILYSLLSQIVRKAIPPNAINRFMSNFSQSLNVYLNIIEVVTQIFDSAPGLSTLQKVNSAYMISTAILSVKHVMEKISTSENYILNAQIKILSGIYLKQNLSGAKTGQGDIDNKLLTAFKEWITTGSKGCGNFEDNAGFVINNKKLTRNILESLGEISPPEDELYFINNAVTVKVGIPPFFCPLASIMDGQPTCNTYDSSMKNNGVEYGTMDVIIRDGDVTFTSKQRTNETMRYHVRIEPIPNTKKVQISAFLKIGDEILINIGMLSSTPNSGTYEPPIIIDLNSRTTPLEASECLKDIIAVNIDTLVNPDGSVKKWDEYLNYITSEEIRISTKIGDITANKLRQRIVTASFKKGIGDCIQEFNTIFENGGYTSGPSYITKPGTKILPPNKLRLGLSNDRPSGTRTVLLLLFGRKDVNKNSIGGFINPEGKYLIAIRNKKMRGGRFFKYRNKNVNFYKKTNKQKQCIVNRKFKKSFKKQCKIKKNISIKKNKRTKTIKRRNNK
jgi:hypothetical protein